MVPSVVGALAGQQVFRRTGAHFTATFEGPADEAVAFRALELLEAAYYRIGSALNVYPTEPVEVVLHSLEQFHDVTRSPAWAAGLYDGRIHVPIKDADRSPEQLAEVLAHEYAHAVVAALAGRSAPAWLNEGLASVMEPGGALDLTDRLARTSARIPLAKLRESFEGLPAGLVPLAYAQSAHAVRRLIQLRGGAAVVTLLRGLKEGEAFEAAFQSALGIRFEEFDAMVTR